MNRKMRRRIRIKYPRAAKKKAVAGTPHNRLFVQ
jgi:hypothetical protein